MKVRLEPHFTRNAAPGGFAPIRFDVILADAVASFRFAVPRIGR